MQMHVAESKVQAVVGAKRYGTTLVGHLHELGLLAPNFTAAHAIWLDDDDIARLADAGASVAHNPGSNLKLGSGLGGDPQDARPWRARSASAPTAAISSDNLNMFEAMRMAAFGSRVQGPDPRQWLSAAEAFEAATDRRRARARHGEAASGSSTPGYKADVVFLDLTSINYVPLNEPLLHVVFCEDGTGIDRVMVGGKMVVQDGRVIGIDMAKLASEANAAVARLAEVNAQRARLRADVGAGRARLLRRARARALSRAPLVRPRFVSICSRMEASRAVSARWRNPGRWCGYRLRRRLQRSCNPG